MRKAIVADASKCYACLACVVECSHRRAGLNPDAPITAQSFAQSSCDVQAVGTAAVPLQCNHCEDAPCVTVCPSGAMRREMPEGPVMLEMARCIGCKACIIACPFGMIRLMPDGSSVIKCDLCYDRTSLGLNPACVSACPSGALEYKELDDVVDGARKRTAAAQLASADD